MSKKTRQVQVGSVRIGGGAPVSVQSMTNTDTADVEKTLSQIRALTVAGADIVRVSVYNEACADAVRALVDGSPVPLVADIHFDYKLANKADCVVRVVCGIPMALKGELPTRRVG